MEIKKETSEEEYLRMHLEGMNPITQEMERDKFVQVEATRTSDLQYLTFDIKHLPCGRFYPSGAVLKVRAAQVREIQSYSMVDDNNIYDVVEKMNDILQSCIRIHYLDGRVGSYLDIKDQDRLYLIFLIRELTFQKGSTLGIDVECCGKPMTIELKRENFRFYETNDALFKKYYDPSKNAFVFKLKNGRVYELTPPTIGIQKAFSDYMIKENSEKRKPDLAFLKIIPFLLGGRTTVTYEGIKEKYKEFQNPEIMDDDSFQFLFAAVDKLVFGIKELVKYCECGGEIRTEMMFPHGASGIFIIHDAFETLIQE